MDGGGYEIADEYQEKLAAALEREKVLMDELRLSKRCNYCMRQQLTTHITWECDCWPDGTCAVDRVKTMQEEGK